MRDSSEMRLAVLIDADNAPRKSIKAIMQEIAVYGTPTLKRIYGDWTAPQHSSWKKLLLENAIVPVQQYSYTTGKNATDSAMIIDAMDILYSGNVDGFCLVSSDSDFTRLATRLREAGMKVIGFGEKKTPGPFIVACDRFIYTEVIGKQDKDVAASDSQGAGHDGSDNHSKSKGQKKSTAKISREVIDTISATIDDVADEDGWAYLGEVGSLLQKKQPDFDSRNFGYKKLTLLIEAIEEFEMDYRGSSQQQNNGKLIFVRNRK